MRTVASRQYNGHLYSRPRRQGEEDETLKDLTSRLDDLEARLSKLNSLVGKPQLPSPVASTPLSSLSSASTGFKTPPFQASYIPQYIPYRHALSSTTSTIRGRSSQDGLSTDADLKLLETYLSSSSTTTTTSNSNRSSSVHDSEYTTLDVIDDTTAISRRRRNKKRTDPVARYHELHKLWSRDPFLAGGGDKKTSTRRAQGFRQVFAALHELEGF